MSIVACNFQETVYSSCMDNDNVTAQDYIDALTRAEDMAETTEESQKVYRVRLALLAALADADEIIG